MLYFNSQVRNKTDEEENETRNKEIFQGYWKNPAKQ